MRKAGKPLSRSKSPLRAWEWKGFLWKPCLEAWEANAGERQDDKTVKSTAQAGREDGKSMKHFWKYAVVAGAADGEAGEHGATAAAGHRQRRRTARAMASLGHGERWPARGDGEEEEDRGPHRGRVGHGAAGSGEAGEDRRGGGRGRR